MVFETHPKPGRLLLAYVLLESFENFCPDPYYEPLPIHDSCNILQYVMYQYVLLPVSLSCILRYDNV